MIEKYAIIRFEVKRNYRTEKIVIRTFIDNSL